MEEYKIDKKNNAAYYFIDRHLDTKIENKKVFLKQRQLVDQYPIKICRYKQIK